MSDLFFDIILVVLVLCVIALISTIRENRALRKERDYYIELEEENASLHQKLAKKSPHD